jgi:hypothetical protein
MHCNGYGHTNENRERVDTEGKGWLMKEYKRIENALSE